VRGGEENRDQSVSAKEGGVLWELKVQNVDRTDKSETGKKNSDWMTTFLPVIPATNGCCAEVSSTEDDAYIFRDRGRAERGLRNGSRGKKKRKNFLVRLELQAKKEFLKKGPSHPQDLMLSPLQMNARR